MTNEKIIDGIIKAVKYYNYRGALRISLDLFIYIDNFCIGFMTHNIVFLDNSKYCYNLKTEEFY